MILTRLQLIAIGALAAILLVITLVLTVQLNGFLWIDGAWDKLEKCQRDNNELRAGAAEARRLNEQQIQRIEKEQEEISDEIERDLTARLERLRNELRSKAAPRNPGSPQAGPDGQAPASPDGEAGVCLAPEELLRAAENEERHDQLIRWVEEQLKVER